MDRTYDLREFLKTGEQLTDDGSGPGINSTVFARAQAAVTAAGRPGEVFIPDGDYVLGETATANGVHIAIRWATRCGWVGESQAGTRLYSDAGSTPFVAAYGPALEDVTFRRLTLDCSAQHASGYTTQLKGLFAQDIKRLRVEDVTFIGSWSTALGCDALQDYQFSRLTFYNPGRQIDALNLDPATKSGCSAIGIGTGKYQREAGTISDVIVHDAGRIGLFYEKQTTYPYLSRGHVATNVVVMDSWAALQDAGCDGLNADVKALDCDHGALIGQTILAPTSGMNGDVRIDAERSKVAGVLLGDMGNSERYTICGRAVDSPTGYGVLTTAGRQISDGLTLDVEADGNALAGIYIKPTPDPVRGLTVAGTARNNDHEGVVLETDTDGAIVMADASDYREDPQQTIALFLKGGHTHTQLNRAGLVATGSAQGVVVA